MTITTTTQGKTPENNSIQPAEQARSYFGLALCVGSKQLLQDYEKRPGYSDIVRKAKLLNENSYELSLRKDGGAHNIFALKNFGWSDKLEQEISSKDRKFDIHFHDFKHYGNKNNN